MIKPYLIGHKMTNNAILLLETPCPSIRWFIGPSLLSFFPNTPPNLGIQSPLNIVRCSILHLTRRSIHPPLTFQLIFLKVKFLID